MIGQTHGGKGGATRPTDRGGWEEGCERIWGEKKPWWEIRDEKAKKEGDADA